MKVLVVGSEGREHSIVWKLAQSKRVSQIFCAPGNAGIRQYATCVDIRIDDLKGLCEFAKANEIDLTIVCPEIPLSKGIADLFRKNNLLIFAPMQAAAKISSSKNFAKKFMHKYNVPTAKFAIFDKEAPAIEHVRKAKLPVVIKYDTHAAFESSYICETFDQAKKVIEKSFANFHKVVVIEDYIEGREVSFHVITDGYNAVPLPTTVTYKKAFDGNGGPNTCGMGAIAPDSIVNSELEQKIAEKIFFPVIDGLNNDGAQFCGILSTDLIIDKNDNVYALEFNSSLGDPEAQAILPLLEDDLFEIFYSTAIGALGDDYESFNLSDYHSISVTLVSGNYPGTFKKGFPIEGIDLIDEDDALVFHCATDINKYGELVTNGGRVLTVTSIASTLHRAYNKVYDAIELIDFQSMRYRKDIAKARVEESKIFL